MIFKQFYLSCLAHASYVIGDEKTGKAVVVDPRRDIEPYLEFAKEHGLWIEHVMLTHFHADFLAGHIELRNKTGAKIYVGAAGKTEFEKTPMVDGKSLSIGDVRLEFLSTPGHTPESVSIVVYDVGQDPKVPVSVLTGDTLFVGDVGRPDLMTAIGITAPELAEQLYKSLHDKLLKLPDETLVYPAHGAGSLCGKALGSENHSTIGEQRATNYALQPMSVNEFVTMLTSNLPEAPPYFSFDAELNQQDRPVLGENLSKQLVPLALDDVLHLRNSGAQILDTRHPEQFAASHLRGALNIGLNGKFATWAGYVVDRNKSVVLVGEPGEEEQALIRLGRIGFDDLVVGYLDGGMQAASGRDELLSSFGRVTVEEFDRLRSQPDAPTIIDVRGVGEWETRSVEGNLNLPLQQLLNRLDEVPRDRPLVLYCKGAYRSAIAASILQRDGIENVVDLLGGFDAWDAEHPLATA
ncbi:MAG: hydroxyacylglutathione hydrolase [Planctomycetota bacterium]|jgi:hydroxyacylglutathione hydrolase